jgi:ribosomal protein L37AE/L43A
MNASAKLMEKYGSTQVEIKIQEQPPSDLAIQEGYGCGKCGSKKYRLTPSKIWECTSCGAMFPYIAKFDALQTIKRLFWLTPCLFCHTPWLMHSKRGGYYCLECQPFPIEDWDQLVCAGGVKRQN